VARNGKAYPTAEDALEAVCPATGGELVGQWPYHHADGDEVFIVGRFRLRDGKKDYRPVHPAVDGWRIGDPPGELPLYHLPDLAELPDPVCIVEGEKAADAARSLGLTATTSAHGAESAGKSDWTPLAGRECIILPDHDDKGERYAHDVARRLVQLRPAARVRIVHLPGLPAKGDLVEYVDARRTEEPETIRAAILELADAAPELNAAELIGGPVLRCLADVQPEAVRWLWPGRLALGKLALIFGDPGLGKSWVTMDLAARVSTGAPWPDGSGPAPLGSTIVINAEDDAADTIRPRLDAAGAALGRVQIMESIRRVDDHGRPVDRMFTLADVDQLAQALQRMPDCRLIIIDPVSAYLASTDSHKNAEVRGLLAPLTKLAADHGAAVVMVTHLSKASSARAIYRAMGSLAFIAAVRSAWAVTSDKDHPERRLFLPVKNNLAPDGGGLAFAITDGRVTWESAPVTMRADEALELGNGDHRPGPKPEARNAAAAWLAELLADGPMPVAQIQDEAKAAGYSWTTTMYRAKDQLRVKPRKAPQFGGGWVWALPEAPAG